MRRRYGDGEFGKSPQERHGRDGFVRLTHHRGSEHEPGNGRQGDRPRNAARGPPCGLCKAGQCIAGTYQVTAKGAGRLLGSCGQEAGRVPRRDGQLTG